MKYFPPGIGRRTFRYTRIKREKIKIKRKNKKIENKKNKKLIKK
jgi:hypothetical protein